METISEQKPRFHVGVVLATFLVAFCSAIVFALYTKIAWDDWYITYRASKNLALGYGLTFTPGERIHSFTSPLGTLIPAFLRAALSSDDDTVLWLFRIFGATLLGIAAVLLLSFAKRLELRSWAVVVLIGMTVFDAKIVLNSINGMESAIVIVFLALFLYVITIPLSIQSAILLGLSWSGLMWARPDGFIYVFGICLGRLIFRPSAYRKEY